MSNINVVIKGYWKVAYQWRHEFRSWNADLLDSLEHVYLPVHLELLKHVAGSDY